MGKNKKENFIFTLICCSLMVLGMDCYNVILKNGLSNSFLKDVLISFIPIFFIALITEWFFVGKVAKSIVAKLIYGEYSLIKRVLFTSFLMVCGMCFCMSLIASIIHQGISAQLPSIFIEALCKNFVFALPLQLVIVGPIARSIFFKMYPAN